MTSYAYKAVHSKGRVHKGTMSAANENELAYFLRELDLELIEAKPHPARNNAAFLSTRRRGIPLPARIAFCSQMGDLLGAGLPFTQALDLIIGTMADGAFHDKLATIGNHIRAGENISRAFARDNDVFDAVSVSILAAGETSGDLAATFVRLTQHLQSELTMKRDVTRAVRYPLFLLCLAGGVTTFMMLAVVPQIINFLSNIGQDLPLSTRMLMKGAELFSTLWWIAPPVCIAFYLTLRLLRKLDPALAIKTDRLFLQMPFIGPVIHKLALARLTSSLTLLLKSGLTLPDSLSMARATLGNKAMEQSAFDAHRCLLDGLPLSKATHTLFTTFMIQKLKIGEQSGTLAKTLDEIARGCALEAHGAVETFLGFLEPLLTILVGALLAWIVLAVLGPVYGSLAPLSGGV